MKTVIANKKPRHTVDVALFAAMISVMSWISIPFPVPFTMQTFGVFLCVYCLGTKKALLSVTAYIVLGILGAPVFSGFSGGLAHIISPSGGFIIGFLPAALLSGLLIKITCRNRHKDIFAFLSIEAANILCYITGCIFYAALFLEGPFEKRLISGFLVCCVPYIIPDIIKNLLVITVGKRIKKIGY